MNRQDVTEKAREFEQHDREALRACWIVARKESGLSPRDFSNEMRTFKNVTDGRCPDGCCGNEDAAPWRPTPAEWVVMADYVAKKFPVAPARRTSGPAKRTGSRRW